MNKTELIKAVAEQAALSQAQAKAAIDAAIVATTSALTNGDSIAIPGFCTMSVGVRPARQGKNPLTGEVLNIAEKKVVKFKAGKALSEAVSK